jgi:hypothetical protein
VTGVDEDLQVALHALHCMEVEPSKFAAAAEAGHAMCYAEEAASEGHTET